MTTSTDLPVPGAKILSRRHLLLNGGIQEIHRVGGCRVPPPIRRRLVGQIETQEDNNSGNGKADVHASGSDVVEAHPPATVLVHDVFVKHVADDTPREVVERRGRRDSPRAAENQRRGQVADVGLGEHASADVDDDGEESTDEPEP